MRAIARDKQLPNRKDRAKTAETYCFNVSLLKAALRSSFKPLEQFQPQGQISLAIGLPNESLLRTVLETLKLKKKGLNSESYIREIRRGGRTD
ncbi:MAG: hypothetical protein D6742_06785 [Cyanobacteria bacterium J069]|nr:MAG: hypothetical protein D6742_06785 [Cyanobacteria bacterium J069]